MKAARIPVRSPSMRRRRVYAEKKGPQKSAKASPQKKRKAKKQAGSDHDSADDAAEDGAFLANTRRENPHARGGRPYDTDQEPLTASLNVTSYQRLRRRLTLRNRINPHPVTSEEVENHLFAAGWDVDRAYQRWHAEHMEAIVPVVGRDLPRPSFNVRVGSADDNSNAVDDEGFPDNENYIPYPYNGSSELERRQLVRFLRDLVEDARDLENTISLRRSEAIMLLRETGWDVIQARDLYLEHQHAFEEVFNSYRQFRGPTQLRSERDDRLSRLIDMTGRRDIDSLDAHLRRHNYNFISAVVAWQKSGIPAINIAERPVVDPIEDDAVWESETESDVEEEQDQGDETDQENDVVKHVTTINTDRVGANRGVPDHTKMMVEYIRNGRYSARIFRHRNYRWSDEDPEDRPEFDWNRQEDLNILNSWRREVFGRIDGAVTQPRSVPWLDAEDDFIYDLHRERWDELIAAQPNVDPQSLLPLEVRAPRQREWAQRFNAQFAGHIVEGSDQRRPNRSFGAINTRRHRIQRVVNDFGLEPNDPHPKGEERKAGSKRKRTKHSAESESPTKGRQDEVDKDRDENGDDDREDPSGDDDGAETPGSGKKKQAKASRRKPAPKKPNKGKGKEGRGEW